MQLQKKQELRNRYFLTGKPVVANQNSISFCFWQSILMCQWSILRKKKERGEKLGRDIAICVVCSMATSIITTKILATHYFKIVDGYVKEMAKMTEDFVKSIRCKL